MSALELAERLEAHEPPEARGLGRDDVAMLVSTRHDGSLVHARFGDLPELLRAGDLLVVNTSATLPAALDARLDGRPVELRLSTPATPDMAVPGMSRGLSPGHGFRGHGPKGHVSTPVPHWVVELRTAERMPFARPPTPASLELPGAAAAELVAPFAASERLAVARLELGEPLLDYLRRHGHPIRYSYVAREWPLSAYQTVFSREPGSAEMPSAGRPFTHELVTELVCAGVLVAPVKLHTGVSSLERGESPYPERYLVPRPTLELAAAVRGRGGRVIAVGTTVVRALETAAAAGTTDDAAGWTRLVVTPERGPLAVDGLLTGWHEPESSHLQMLDAVAGTDLRKRSYHAALARGYRWHEFGDVHLILP
jgi:S-adenosylmethionine:tRNA ribosyltransferase-isomerase